MDTSHLLDQWVGKAGKTASLSRSRGLERHEDDWIKPAEWWVHILFIPFSKLDGYCNDIELKLFYIELKLLNTMSRRTECSRNVWERKAKFYL